MFINHRTDLAKIMKNLARTVYETLRTFIFCFDQIQTRTAISVNVDKEQCNHRTSDINKLVSKIYTVFADVSFRDKI